MEKLDADTLVDWLDAADLYIIDVRSPAAWDESHLKIKHARHFEAHEVENWGKALPRDKKAGTVLSLTQRGHQSPGGAGFGKVGLYPALRLAGRMAGLGGERLPHGPQI